MMERCRSQYSGAFHFKTKILKPSFHNSLCLSSSISFSISFFSVASLLSSTACPSGVSLSVVYTEDIKWSAFTKMLELQHQECCCLSGCAERLEDISKANGKARNVGKQLLCFSHPKQLLDTLEHENLLKIFMFQSSSFVLPLISKPKAISSVATFG